MIINEIINNYYDWLKSETTINMHENGYYEITAPFVDNSNDYISIYFKKNDNEITLTDDGYYLSMIEAYGVNIEGNRLKTIEMICKSNGIKLVGNELMTKFSLSNDKNIYQNNLHKMIQTILRVDDMILNTKSRVKSYFYDDVINFLDENEIGYSPDIAIIGKSGLINNYDFIFQKTKKHSERFGRVINNLTKQSMTTTLFMWSDTYGMRKSETELIIFANDDNKIDSEAKQGFENYGVRVIDWSQRNNFIDLLK